MTACVLRDAGAPTARCPATVRTGPRAPLTTASVSVHQGSEAPPVREVSAPKAAAPVSPPGTVCVASSLSHFPVRSHMLLQSRAEGSVIGHPVLCRAVLDGTSRVLFLPTFRTSRTDGGSRHFFPVVISLPRWHHQQDMFLDPALSLANGVPEIQ